MIRSLLAGIYIAILSFSASAQVAEGKFTVFTGKGQQSSIDQIMKSLDSADVVFLGEFHDDSVAHALQFEIFKRAIEKYAAKRRVTLALEMFERDVQTALNEYLAGQISENHFLLSSRPWPRYKDDYRPLVELAKEKKLDVVAANAPRRYVNMVSRNGRDGVNGLSPLAKTWLAPLPYEEASEAYSKKFKALMGSSAEASMGIDKILSSQSLWDATMAYSVAESLKKNKGSLVVHLNGGFHTEMRLGTVEHFLKYRKNGRAVVVTMRYEDDFKKFDPAKHSDAGDFVILTQKQTRPQGVLQEVLRRMDDFYGSMKTLKAEVHIDRASAVSDARSYFVSLKSSDEKQPKLRLDAMPQTTRPDEIPRYMAPRPKVFLNSTDFANDRDAALINRFVMLSGKSLRAEFDVQYIGEATANGVRSWHLRLTPTKSNLSPVSIWVDQDGMIRRAAATEDAVAVSIQFANFKTNINIDDEVFRAPASSQR
ncbi:MAG: ChaN family lipoprotein [Pyrinomonadaceae bacterium]